MYNGLIQVKEEGWTEFSEGRQGCSEGFSEGKALGNPDLVHPDSFTWIYILFKKRHFGDISDFFLQILMFEEA